MTSAYSIANAEFVVRTLSRSNLQVERAQVSSATGFPTSRLPDSVRSKSSAALASLSLTDSRTLVGRALDAAETVISGLSQLKTNLSTAIGIGYLGAMPDESRLTLQADSNILIGRMDAAVKAATVGTANLVQGGSRDVRLATTQLGGEIKAAVQALDSRSLGIAGLDLTTGTGIKEAKAKIEAALNDSKVKYENINALSRAFGYQGSFFGNVQAVLSEAVVSPTSVLRTYNAAALATSYASAGGGGGSRGSTVNLLA